MFKSIFTSRISKKAALHQKRGLKKFTQNYKKKINKYKSRHKFITKIASVYSKTLSSSYFRVFLILLISALVIFLLNNSSASGGNLVYAKNIFARKQEAPKAASVIGPAQADSQFAKYPSWSQNFSAYHSGKLNSRDWRINIGWPQNGNNEAEYYTDSKTNLRIDNGSLVMEATKQPEPGGHNYASSRIDTYGKVSFLYGRIDVTAKLPAGVGTWPAIWFLPANTKYEDKSPASDTTRFLNGGEIDMAEAVGFNPNIVYGVVHTLQTNQNNPNAVGDFNQVELANNNTEYYTYSLLWTPTSITFLINNAEYFTYTKPAGSNYVTWPFDQPFYMIMNLALGGEWGGEDSAQFPPNGIDDSALPAQMDIKSIYYYPYLSQAN